MSVYREDGPEEKDFQFLFLETEIKNSWEAYFEDAKQKLGKHWILRNLFLTMIPSFQLKCAFILCLAYAKDIFPPEFQYCIPINKTRSGMQVTIDIPRSAILNRHYALLFLMLIIHHQASFQRNFLKPLVPSCCFHRGPLFFSSLLLWGFCPQ